jgi:predicted CXXCH cytochrome family protein
MGQHRFILLKLIFFQLIIASLAHSQNDGCITSKCHQTISTEAWVHGPVGVGVCTVCHNPVEGQEHQFNFALEKQDLCFACHDASRDMMMENHRHTPVANGDCTGCHDPHQSEYRFMLKNKTTELCYSCHDKNLFEGSHIHGPVSVGDCIACHDPHATAYPKQLKDGPDRFCFKCHVEHSGILESRHTHPPVAEDCKNCHNPHASEARYLLINDMPELCLTCHDNIADYDSISHKHSPVQEGNCKECHNVHGSSEPVLLTGPLTNVCFRCHEELGEYVTTQPFKHGPIKQNDCNACHDPHGSDYHHILQKYFPEDFYVPYQEDNYSLCFECHNRQVALEEETETLTDFRNGKRNLHHLHEKGRSCRACHQVHASSQSKHVRLTVPYGSMKWELPIKFTKTENGGSCEVGCHSPKEYSRK